MEFVKIIINEWDPIDLLSHCPDDEYHSEIKEIYQLLCLTDDSNELADGIFKIFIDSFDEEIFKKSKAECKCIARKLLSQKYRI